MSEEYFRLVLPLASALACGSLLGIGLVLGAELRRIADALEKIAKQGEKP
jgi:hypothetical protein